MKLAAIISIILLSVFVSCTNDPIVPVEEYECTISFIDSSDNHPKKASFENALDELEQIVPGVQVSVRSKDGNLWTGSQGFADINNGVAMRNCSRFLVGSVSKTFTSVLIMQLQEEGILSIKDPIRDWIETELIDKIENANDATIENLLMHTSGIKEYIDVQFQIDRLNNSKLLLTPREKLKYIFDKPSDFGLDEKYGYSNSNYVLLGLIIEKARDMSLDSVIDVYISDVLSLENTKMGTSENPIPSGTSRPYLDVGNGQFQDIMDFALSDAATADGGIISNTQDLVFFIENIVNTTLVSQMSFEQMLNNRVEVEANEWYGLGIEIENNDNGLRISHGGGTEGYLAFLINYPDSNVSVAVCLNSLSQDEQVVSKIKTLLEDLQNIAFE